MRLRNTLAACVAALAAATATAGPYTDLWFNPQESGWGLNLVQQGERAFATLFVYGADGKPDWFVASDAPVVAYTASGFPQFRGTLYRTEGPWHGGPFNPGDVRIIAVGTLSLEVMDYDRMRVTYVADGVGVTREVRRNTFEAVIPATSYSGQFLVRFTEPGNPVPRSSRYEADLYTEFVGGQAWIRVIEADNRVCHYRGAYRQAGKLLSVAGGFSCFAGSASEGTFEMTRLEVTADGVTGFLRKQSTAGAGEYGRFSATRY